MLNRLPLADREVLAARYLSGLEYEEVAAVLGCSVNTAYVRCKRARERLRTLLRQADEEETRRTMQRAMSGIIAGLLGDAFVHKVLQQVKQVEMTAPHPARFPKGSTAWHTAGWKIAAGLLVVAVIAGFRLAHRLPASPTIGLPATPVVQQLPAASRSAFVAQHNSHNSHQSHVSSSPVRGEQSGHIATQPLLLANAAAPDDRVSPTPEAHMIQPPDAHVAAAAVTAEDGVANRQWQHVTLDGTKPGRHTAGHLRHAEHRAALGYARRQPFSSVSPASTRIR